MSQKNDPRVRLLEAGEKLAPYLDLGQLTPKALAAEAELDAGVFTAEFGSIETYLAALQARFMTELRDLVVQAAIQQTGVARLRDGEHVQPGEAGMLIGLGHADLGTDLAGMGRAVRVDRPLAGNEQERADPAAGQEIGDRGGRRRQHDAVRREA